MLRCCLMGLVLWGIGGGLSATEPDLQLTLPPAADAVAGAEMGIYFDNVVLSPSSGDFRFEVDCALGQTEARRWTVTPTAADVGEHPWRLKVFSGEKLIAEQALTLRVQPSNVGAERTLRLLIVGDSLTHASVTANDLARRLALPGQPRTTFLGTHRPAGADPGVVHEGYGGWTWARFVKHYEPNPDPAARKMSSPFVFLTGDQPQLDVGRYIREQCAGQPPDVVLFLLGINDCFSARTDDPAALDAHIDGVLQQAEVLLAAFRSAAPHADLGLCLTTPGNSRESGFEANYKGRYPQRGWKRIQHRLVQRELAQFSGREAERIFVVPTELNLDPVAGYPVDNAVHPNALGYQQIAATMHAWLISRMASRERQ